MRASEVLSTVQAVSIVAEGRNSSTTHANINVPVFRYNWYMVVSQIGAIEPFIEDSIPLRSALLHRFEVNISIDLSVGASPLEIR